MGPKVKSVGGASKYEPKKMAVSQRPKDPSARGTKRERERVARAAKRQMTGKLNADADRRGTSGAKVKESLARFMNHRTVRIGPDDGQRRLPIAPTPAPTSISTVTRKPRKVKGTERSKPQELSLEQLAQCARLSHNWQLRESAKISNSIRQK